LRLIMPPSNTLKRVALLQPQLLLLLLLRGLRQRHGRDRHRIRVPEDCSPGVADPRPRGAITIDLPRSATRGYSGAQIVVAASLRRGVP
jgi:hypothetical protein